MLQRMEEYNTRTIDNRTDPRRQQHVQVQDNREEPPSTRPGETNTHCMATQLIGGAQVVSVKEQDVQLCDGLHSQNHAVSHQELKPLQLVESCYWLGWETQEGDNGTSGRAPQTTA